MLEETEFRRDTETNEAGTGAKRDKMIGEMVDAAERLTAALIGLEGLELDAGQLGRLAAALNNQLLLAIASGSTRQAMITYEVDAGGKPTPRARCMSIREALKEHEAAGQTKPDRKGRIVARVWSVSRYRELDELEIDALEETEVTRGTETREGEAPEGPHPDQAEGQA